MSSSYPPYYGYPSAPPLQRVLPEPPRLHWGWVLLFSILTLGLFASVWLLVQANWIRKMRQGKSTAFWVALANLLWLPLVFVFAVGVGLASTLVPSGGAPGVMAALDSIIRMGSFILYLAAVYVMRSEMEADPIGIPLGGVMTFFFAVFYFQYHLSDYGRGSQAAEGLGLSARPDIPVPNDGTVHYPTPAELGMAYPPQPPQQLPPLDRPS